MEAFFSKAFCNAFVCNVFIATVEPNNRNVHTYSAPLLLRYGHLRRLLFLEMCLYSFFVCFFFSLPFRWTLILASKSLKDYHFLLQLQQSESRATFVILMSFPCSMANTTVRVTHENDNRLRNPSCAGDFPRQICQKKGVTQPTDLNGRLAHKSNSEFLFFGSAKSQKIERGGRTSGSARAHHRNQKWEAKDFFESLTD